MREGVLWTNLSRREITDDWLKSGDPVISMDTKKKELIGNFAREGRTYTQTQVDTLDHDFPSAGEGKVIPHGLYALARNEGYVHLNTSHDTSEFCCDSVAHWWKQHGCRYFLMPAVCCCSVTVAAATPVIGMSSRKRYKSWPISLDWTSASPTIRRTARNITPSNIGCFHMLRVLVGVLFFIRSLSSNTLWRWRKRPQD